jgi:hypothetical protein
VKYLIGIFILFIIQSSFAQTPKCWMANSQHNNNRDNGLSIVAITSAGSPAICYFNVKKESNGNDVIRTLSFSTEGLLTYTTMLGVFSSSTSTTSAVHAIYILPAVQEPKLISNKGNALLELASKNKITVDKNLNLQIADCIMSFDADYGLNKKPINITSCKGRVVIDTHVGRGAANSASNRLSSTISDEYGNKCNVSNSVLFQSVGEKDSRIRFQSPQKLCEIIDNNCSGRLRINRDLICRAQGFQGPNMPVMMGSPPRDLDKQKSSGKSTHQR